MDEFLKQVEIKAKNFFELSDDEKDIILAEFADYYIRAKVKAGKNQKGIIDSLTKDIIKVEGDNRFELAAVMNMVKNSFINIIDEMDQLHKQQTNKK